MLRSIKNMLGFAVFARDGEVGSIHDFFLEEASWIIRYLAVDLGFWRFGRKVLVATMALERWDWPNRRLHLSLDKAQIEKSPEMDIRKPVDRHYENRLAEYFGWPAYWPASGIAPVPSQAPPVLPSTPLPSTNEELQSVSPSQADSFLRSTGEFLGCRLEAANGVVGHLDDLLAEEAGWRIRHLVAETSKVLPGRKILIPLLHLEQVEWLQCRAWFDLPLEMLRSSPEYDPSRPLTPAMEEAVRAHYGTGTRHPSPAAH